jgi:hypothetical protein
LDRGVCLEEEIPVASLGDAAVDDGAVHRVATTVCFFSFRGIKASVMALPDNDDGDMRPASLGICGRVHRFAGGAESGKFLFKGDVILPFRYSIAVHKYIFRQSFVPFFPE